MLRQVRHGMPALCVIAGCFFLEQRIAKIFLSVTCKCLIRAVQENLRATAQHCFLPSPRATMETVMNFTERDSSASENHARRISYHERQQPVSEIVFAAVRP